MMLSSSVQPYKQCSIESLLYSLFSTTLSNELALYFRKMYKNALSVNKTTVRHTNDSAEENIRGKKYSRTYDTC